MAGYHERTTEALTAGAIRFELVLRDYDGSSDDACVWSRFELDGVPGGEFVPAVVVDGTLEASGGAYQMYAPFPDSEAFFKVDVVSARVSVPLNGTDATLGGTVLWYGPLRNQLFELIREISDSIDAATVDAIVLPQADMRTPEAPPGTCDALSFGVDARFERVEE